MGETEQFRFTRWGIPGWIAILSFIALVFVDILLTPQIRLNPLYKSLRDIFDASYSTATALITLFIAAIGVPLGFCIYQFYFYIRWNSPFSRNGLFPPLINGRCNDLDRTLRDIKPEAIDLGQKWRKSWIDHPLYITDQGWRWRYIENLFVEVAQYIDNEFRDQNIYLQHRKLLDLMHTLGASLAGVYLGFGAYLIAKTKFQHSSITMNIIITTAFLLLLIIILDWEDSAKKDLEDKTDINNNKEDYQPAKKLPIKILKKQIFCLRFAHPSVIFLFFLTSFLYVTSPSPYMMNNDYPRAFLRIVVVLSLIIIWLLSKRKAPRDIRWTEMLFLVISVLIAYILAKNCSNLKISFDWPFYWSVLLFIISNLIFLKNRQNVRDDLIAFEYYTIQRYFEFQDSNKTSV